jgi:hypothetical protein
MIGPEVTATVKYGPDAVAMLAKLPVEPQTFEFYHTLFTFSPRGRASVKIGEFKGYMWLSGFKPEDANDGEPEAEITIEAQWEAK